MHAVPWFVYTEYIIRFTENLPGIEAGGHNIKILRNTDINNKPDGTIEKPEIHT